MRARRRSTEQSGRKRSRGAFPSLLLFTSPLPVFCRSTLTILMSLTNGERSGEESIVGDRSYEAPRGVRSVRALAIVALALADHPAPSDIVLTLLH